MGFLAGEAYLATQEAKKKGNRQTRTSMRAATISNDADVTTNTRKKVGRKRSGTNVQSRQLPRRKRVSEK